MFGYIAAGYTTLVCYMVYSIAHYKLMNIVCEHNCEGIKPYDTRRILVITVPFVAAGFVFLATYDYPIVRYGIIVIAIIIAAVLRNRIIGVLQGMLALKKKTN